MIKESDIVKSTPLADNVTNSGNSYIKFYSEYEILHCPWAVRWCVIMMKLKVRLETDEWIYEEHEMI